MGRQSQVAGYSRWLSFSSFLPLHCHSLPPSLCLSHVYSASFGICSDDFTFVRYSAQLKSLATMQLRGCGVQRAARCCGSSTSHPPALPCAGARRATNRYALCREFDHSTTSTHTRIPSRRVCLKGTSCCLPPPPPTHKVSSSTQYCSVKLLLTATVRMGLQPAGGRAAGPAARLAARYHQAPRHLLLALWCS